MQSRYCSRSRSAAAAIISESRPESRGSTAGRSNGQRSRVQTPCPTATGFPAGWVYCTCTATGHSHCCRQDVTSALMGTVGSLGRPNRAVPVPFTCLASFQWHVWFSSSHLSPARSRSSALLHPARLRLLNFYFPLDAGWLDAGRECLERAREMPPSGHVG
jgi:hypothetical protein